MANITILATFFSAGIVIAFENLNSSIFGFIFLIIFIFSLILFYLARINKTNTTLSKIICLISIGLFLGVVRGQIYEDKVLPENFYGIKTFSGEVLMIPESKNGLQKITVNIINEEAQNTDGYVLINTSLYPRYKPGMMLTISGEIKRGEIILPIPPDNYKSFNYEKYLGDKNIDGTMIFPKIEIVGKSERFIYSLYEFKSSITDTINKKIPLPESALINGIVFGQDELSKDIESTVRASGLSHIIVLSGFNLAIIISFILLIFSRTPLLFRLVISSLLVFLFIVMVGASPSLVRAAIMAYVSLLALFLGKEYYALEALMFSILLYGIFSPASILTSVSLHLSFLATLGLILLYNPTEKLISLFTDNLLVKSAGSATISATIMTAPYLIYTFSEFSVFSILANILVIPIVPLIMAFAVIFVIFAWVPFLSTTISFILYLFAMYVLKVSEIVSSLPFSNISIQISVVGASLAYISIFSLILYLKYTQKIKIKEKENNYISF